MLSCKNIIRLLKNSNGFSVVEILVSMVIVLLLVTVITPMVVFTSQTNQYNRSKLTAKNIANERIEEIRAMSFGDVGTIVGNPEGNIPQLETIEVDGRDYQVETLINWVDRIGCMQGFVDDDSEDFDADWDVKQVRVLVTRTGYYANGNMQVREEIDTLISRDFEQPLLTGSNIRICVFKGWDYMVFDNVDDKYKPLSNVGVTISGPSNQTISSTNSGTALFIGINPGNYTAEASSFGMMVFPGSYPKEISVAENTTKQAFAFLEIPSTITVTFKDELYSNITVDSPGELVLSAPYGGIDDLEGDSHYFEESTIVNSYLTVINNLWPFPKDHANAYVFDVINIPGYLLSLMGIYDVDKDEEWQGYLEGPDTNKELIIYLWKIPEIDDTNADGEEWILASSGEINFHLSEEDKDIDRAAFYTVGDYRVLSPGIFNRYKQNNNLDLPANKDVDFIGTSLIFKGEELNISNDSKLELHANYIRFENEIKLRSTAEIILHTLKCSDYSEDFKEVLWPLTNEGADQLSYKVPVSECEVNNNHYSVLLLEKDVYMGPSGNRELIIEKGAYLFPDGFNFGTDYNKEPGNGGLELIAN